MINILKNLFHQHKWCKPNGRWQTCRTCGELQLIPCEHYWEDLTYVGTGQLVQKCTKCGEVTSVELYEPIYPNYYYTCSTTPTVTPKV